MEFGAILISIFLQEELFIKAFRILFQRSIAIRIKVLYKR
ncbi:hypothetical protein LMANV2_530017 [Leptospira interrogans serovar Manilae]|uniref:Uncharacterized protein n=1 Tax=Leptospira interrogans serovar Manilae TaxID=214675 RepID=A0AAQ1P0R4_LEPIR|nr:hypothetical protein LMANV2_530017 [Leptospira interrogans serovar Manilae]